MTPWRFYDPATGLFRRIKVAGSWNNVSAMVPEGAVPIVGAFDPLSQRVAVETPRPPDAPDDWMPPVVDYVPPAPADTALATYSWDAGIKRWVSTPTLIAVKKDAIQRMAQGWNAERAAGMDVGSVRVPTDAAAWTRYLAIKAMAADAGWVDIPIPLADGETFELLTAAKATALWAALKSFERSLLAKLRDRVEAVKACATKEEVEAITWD